MMGILGGMGPLATIRLYRNIIETCQKEFGMKNNDEYPHMLIYNLPVPDLISDKKRGDIALAMINNGLKKLEHAGADFIIIPCNTVHVFIDELRKSVNIPIISIVDETVNLIKNTNIRKVGIIGSKTTLTERLYQDKLESVGIKTIVPENLDCISTVIKRIVCGISSETDKCIVTGIIKEMVENGAGGIVLGCTELPLIISQDDVEVPIFDTLRIIADKSITTYKRFKAGLILKR